MEHSRLEGGNVDLKVVWQVEAQWEKRMKGSVSACWQPHPMPNSPGQSQGKRGKEVGKLNKHTKKTTQLTVAGEQAG